MKASKIFPRNRRVKDRATGTVFFNLAWTSGKFSKRENQYRGLEAAVKFLRHQLAGIPKEEVNSLEAKLFAEVRKTSGALGRDCLGRMPRD